MEWNGYTDWLQPQRVAAELRVDPKKVYDWAERKYDPLPVYLPDGNDKQWRVYRPDLNAWLKRNWKEKLWTKKK